MNSAIDVKALGKCAVLMGGDMMVGAATGVTVGIAVAGPVGGFVGGTLGGIAGA